MLETSEPCDAEHVQMACQIITSCVLLGQASFLQRYADAVVHSLQALIGKLSHLLLLTGPERMHVPDHILAALAALPP